MKPFSLTLPRVVEHETKQYHNVSFSMGIRMPLNESWEIRLNTGYTKRSPEINERFSFGLHQAVAGIEEGNRNLNSEHSLKGILTQSIHITEKLNMELSLYSQFIRDFIYLEPQKELRLTIRGAFPLYIYKQTNARISGIDFLGRYEFGHHWQILIQSAYLLGKDLKMDDALVYMPPNQFSAGLSYQMNQILGFKNLKIELRAKHVFKQNQIPEGQEFLAAPDAYWLLNPSLETEFKLFNKNFKLNIQLDNMLNTRYRDYLNRLRYFADEEGLSLNIKLKMNF